VAVHDKGRVFNTNLIFTLELGFMLDCAETIIAGALERKESRGAHTRTDIPDRDDAQWLKHIVVTKGEETPNIEYAPVTITRWPTQVRSYQPSPEGVGTGGAGCKLVPGGARGGIAQVIGLRLNRGPASRGCRCERMTPGQKKHRGIRRTSNPEPTAVGSTVEFISRQCFHQCGRSFRDNADDVVSHRVRHFPPLCKFRELQSAGAPGKPCCQVCQCDLGFGAR